MAILLLPVQLHAIAHTPIPTLLAPVVLQRSAKDPKAMLHDCRLFCKADCPIAILLTPVLFVFRAHTPIAMLQLPVVFELSELVPNAILKLPDVLLINALVPMPTLKQPVMFEHRANRPMAMLLHELILL